MSSAASVPLTDALPWDDDGDDKSASTILVCDLIETDGRFLLYTVATSPKKVVLWLGCGSVSSKQIATALKKMGSDAAASILKRNEYSSRKIPLHIHSLSVEMAERLLRQDGRTFDGQLYLKEVYNRIKTWIQLRSSEESALLSCIILDDVSALATLLGNALVYCFVASVRALCRSRNNARLFMRCSHDAEYLARENSIIPASWIGAGGQDHAISSLSSQLVELADYVVDVLPLASGYSREAHGRLIFTSSIKKTPLMLNYCLHESSVSAIRLQN